MQYGQGNNPVIHMFRKAMISREQMEVSTCCLLDLLGVLVIESFESFCDVLVASIWALFILKILVVVVLTVRCGMNL